MYFSIKLIMKILISKPKELFAEPINAKRFLVRVLNYVTIMRKQQVNKH